MFDYIGYRVFEYFNKKDKAFTVLNTINFLVVLQGSLIVPLFIFVNLFMRIDPQVFGENNRMKYYIGIPLYIILIAINSYIFKKKLKGEGLKKLKEKYHKERYSLSIWWIFLSPIFFLFIIPIILGAINGTLHFPFLEK
jgi:hypothetical protein